MTTRGSAPDKSRPCPACGITDRCPGCGGCECDCTCWDEASWTRYGPAVTAGVPAASAARRAGHDRAPARSGRWPGLRGRLWGRGVGPDRQRGRVAADHRRSGRAG